MESTIMQSILQRLPRLTTGQKNTLVGNTTVTALLRQLPPDLSNAPLDERQLFALGQLSIVLDILVAQQRRQVLVRWFE